MTGKNRVRQERLREEGNADADPDRFPDQAQGFGIGYDMLVALSPLCNQPANLDCYYCQTHYIYEITDRHGVLLVMVL
jgi:hypothetical protein